MVRGAWIVHACADPQTARRAVGAQKAVFQGIQNRYGASTLCVAPGSDMDVCMNSYTRSEACHERMLNASVSAGHPLVQTYSYETGEDHWSMRSRGPMHATCIPPRELT